MEMTDTWGIDLKIEKAAYWHDFYNKKVVFTLTSIAEYHEAGRYQEGDRLLDWLPVWRNRRDRWWTRLRNLKSKRAVIVNAS